jgi:hypothetical protein
MQPLLAAHADATDDRGSSHDNAAGPPPEEPPAPRRRRWRWRWPGGDFLDGPNDGDYARRWQTACGQGG